MKKLLIFLTFFVLTIFGKSQNWDAVKVGTGDVDSIMQGAVKIWEKPADQVLYMETTSTSATWSPQTVTNSGATLHWEVTGAATYSVDVDDPSFDFSSAGTKYITVTSADDGAGLTYLDYYDNSLTSLDVSGAISLVYLGCGENSLTNLDVSTNTSLTELGCYDNSLTSLDVSTNTSLTYLDCGVNSLTNLDVSTNTSLTELWCGENSLTNLDVSTNTSLVYLGCNSNSLTKTVVDAIMDDLIAFGLDGYTFNCSSQSPAISPDAGKISTLQAQGWTVIY
jgi:hypothetical protein